MSIAVLLAVVLCSESRADGAGTEDHPDPRDFTLRLADLDPGYKLGNDGSCDTYFDDEPSADRDLTYLINECSIDFRRMWMPHGRGYPEPHSVESYAWVLSTPAAAAAQFASVTKKARRPGVPVAVGDEARLTRRTLRYRALVVNRRKRTISYRWKEASTIAELRWRAGPILARILLDGSSKRVTRRAILRLAHKQQARIATPTPLTAADLDDRLVGLDDPGFGVPVWWLGPYFEPGGDLPALEIQSAEGGGGDFDTGPGWTGEIQYGSEPYASEVIIGIWKPRIWKRSIQRRFGRLLWGSRCAISRSFAVDGGRATIYAGYGARPDICDGRRRDSFMAIVRRKRTITTINMPLCYSCGAGGPYASFAALGTVVRALQQRPRQR